MSTSDSPAANEGEKTEDLPGSELEPTTATNLLADNDWAWTFLRSYTGEDHKGNLGNISKAHRAAGVSYDVAKTRRLKDTTFRLLWEQADQAILEAVWAVTLQDAIQGTQRPIFQRGEIVGHAHEIDMPTRRWILERLDPERFHLPTRVEMVSPGAPGAFTFQLGEDVEQIEQGETE